MPPAATEHTDLTAYLAAHAISPHVAGTAGVTWADHFSQLPMQLQGEVLFHKRYLPGVVFPWHGVDGITVGHQYRPMATPWDENRPGRKYDQPAHIHLPLNVHPARRDKVLDPAMPLVIVEGTKQHLAAVTYAPAGFGIIGIFGCNGWQQGGVQHPDFAQIPLSGRVVSVIFDADAGTNRQVYEALAKLKGYLEFEGATFHYVALPVAGTAGLDDLLARVEGDDRRRENLVRLLGTGTPKLPRKPPKPKPGHEEDDPNDVQLSPEEERLRQLEADLPEEGIEEILDALVDRFRRFIVFTDDSHATTLALWVVHTYMLAEHFDYTPRLLFSSATRTSAKSLCMEMLKYLCHHAMLVVNMSASSLFRLVDQRHPCVLFDEVDNANLSAVERSEIVGMFNSGYEREGGGVTRTNRDTMEVEEFDTFAPVALAGISRDALPDPLVSRSILLPMMRAMAVELEGVDKLRWRVERQGFKDMADRVAVWNLRHADEVVLDPMPEVPEELGPRSADVWEPLFCIAAMAGERWLKLAEVAARRDARLHVLEDASPGELTLWAIHDVFTTRRLDASIPVADQDRISSKALVAELLAHDEVPFIQSGKQLRNLLKPFEVEPTRYRVGSKQVRGYLRDAFERAWWRYPPPSPTTAGEGGDGPEDGSDDSTRDPSVTDVTLTATEQSHLSVKLDVTPVTGDPGHTEFDTEPAESLFQSSVTSVTGSTDSEPITGSVVAFDLETGDANALWRWDEEVDFIRLCSVVVDGAEPELVTVEELLEILTESEVILAHNGIAFDLVALAFHADLGPDAYAALAARCVDSLIVARLADPIPGGVGYVRQRGESHDAGTLGQQLLGIPNGKGTLARLKHQYGSYHAIPTDDVAYRHYALTDARIAWGLGNHAYGFGAPLALDWYAEREHSLACMAGAMSLRGIAIDTDLLAVRLADNEARRAALVAELGEMGVPVTKADGKPSTSPWGTAAGKAALDAMLKAQDITVDRTPTGAPSISGDALEEHRGTSRLVDVLLECLAIRSIPEQIADTIAPDGRVHPQINMGQASGRWSFTRPGLTTLGKRSETLKLDRELLVASPGCVLISLDMAQVDARAVAAHCQDRAYRAIFDEGTDLHTAVAIDLFGGPEHRELAKVVNHSSNYGVGPARLVAIAAEHHIVIDEDRAREILESYRASYPRLVAWQHEVRADADAGRLLDNGWGRKLRCDPDRTFTQAPALVGQSAARDVICQGMLNLPAWVADMLVLQIHDEILLDCPADQADMVAAIAHEALTFRWAPEGLHPVEFRADVPRSGPNFMAMEPMW